MQRKNKSENLSYTNEGEPTIEQDGPLSEEISSEKEPTPDDFLNGAKSLLQKFFTQSINDISQQIGVNEGLLSTVTKRKIEALKKKMYALARVGIVTSIAALPMFANADEIPDKNFGQSSAHTEEFQGKPIVEQEYGKSFVEMEKSNPYRYLSKENISDKSMLALVEKSQQGITKDYEKELADKLQMLSRESQNEYMFAVVEKNDGSWQLLPLANLANADTEVSWAKIVGGGSFTLPISTADLALSEDAKTMHLFHNHNSKDMPEIRALFTSEPPLDENSHKSSNVPPSLIDMVGVAKQHSTTEGITTSIVSKVSTEQGVWSFGFKAGVYEKTYKSFFNQDCNTVRKASDFLANGGSLDLTTDSGRAVESTANALELIGESLMEYLGVKTEFILAGAHDDQSIDKIIEGADRSGIDLQFSPYKKVTQ